MKSKVIQFYNSEMISKSPVDGLRIKEYVYSRLDFILPDHIYLVIDSLLADMWNSTDAGVYLSEGDFFTTIEKVRDYDILLPKNRIQRISDLILEALEENDYICKA